jgi:hypothetical protein
VITTLSNSTFSGNELAGLSNANAIITTLSNSTFSGNRDGIINNASAGIFTLVNNTIALNTAIGISNSGFISSHKNNLIAGNGSGGNSNVTGLTLNAADKNLTGTLADVGLDSNLSNNGGTTLTHALLPGSAAINAGDNSAVPTGVTTDQRGPSFNRISGSSVDVGAFEVQLLPTLSIAAGITPVEPTPNSLTNGTYTLTLSSAPTTDLTVNYSLGGTATNAADYTLNGGTGISNLTGSSFVIAAGTTNATFTVQVVDDSLEEPDETIQLTLTSGTGYSLGSDTSTLTIAANDATTPPVTPPVTPARCPAYHSACDPTVHRQRLRWRWHR